MELKWFRTESLVKVDGETVSLVLGIDGDAHDCIESIEVVVSGEGEVVGESDKLAGVEIEFSFRPDADYPFTILILADDNFDCSAEVRSGTPQAKTIAMVSGEANTQLIPLPIISDH